MCKKWETKPNQTLRTLWHSTASLQLEVDTKSYGEDQRVRWANNPPSDITFITISSSRKSEEYFVDKQGKDKGRENESWLNTDRWVEIMQSKNKY